MKKIIKLLITLVLLFTSFLVTSAYTYSQINNKLWNFYQKIDKKYSNISDRISKLEFINKKIDKILILKRNRLSKKNIELLWFVKISINSKIKNYKSELQEVSLDELLVIKEDNSCYYNWKKYEEYTKIETLNIKDITNWIIKSKVKKICKNWKFIDYITYPWKIICRYWFYENNWNCIQIKKQKTCTYKGMLYKNFEIRRASETEKIKNGFKIYNMQIKCNNWTIQIINKSIDSIQCYVWSKNINWKCIIKWNKNCSYKWKEIKDWAYDDKNFFIKKRIDNWYTINWEYVICNDWMINASDDWYLRTECDSGYIAKWKKCEKEIKREFSFVWPKEVEQWQQFKVEWETKWYKYCIPFWYDIRDINQKRWLNSKEYSDWSLTQFRYEANWNKKFRLYDAWYIYLWLQCYYTGIDYDKSDTKKINIKVKPNNKIKNININFDWYLSINWDKVIVGSDESDSYKILFNDRQYITKEENFTFPYLFIKKYLNKKSKVTVLAYKEGTLLWEIWIWKKDITLKLKCDDWYEIKDNKCIEKDNPEVVLTLREKMRNDSNKATVTFTIDAKWHKIEKVEITKFNILWNAIIKNDDNQKITSFPEEISDWDDWYIYTNSEWELEVYSYTYKITFENEYKAPIEITKKVNYKLGKYIK